MALNIASILTGGITNLVGKWFDNKSKESDAKHIQKLTKIETQGNWETTAVAQMAKSFKDEYLLFIFTLPLIATFISPFVDLIMLGNYTQGCLQTAASTGLKGLEDAPDWYTYLIGMITGVSYGLKGVGNIVNKLKGE